MASPDLAYRDQRNAEALGSLSVPDLDRRFVTVPAGTVVICNYDIVHRGSRQLPGQAGRYMYKFYFARTRSPFQDPKATPSLAYARATIIFLWIGNRSNMDWYGPSSV